MLRLRGDGYIWIVLVYNNIVWFLSKEKKIKGKGECLRLMEKVGFILFIGFFLLVVNMCVYVWELDIDVAKHNL